jgi:hypothetical protein
MKPPAGDSTDAGRDLVAHGDCGTKIGVRGVGRFGYGNRRWNDHAARMNNRVGKRVIVIEAMRGDAMH